MLVGQLGVGRRHPATGVSLLIPRRLAPPPALAFDFERLRADAQRLQQRLAAHDRQVAAAAPPAPRAPASKPAPWPTSSGSPSPLLSAGEQARRKRERKALEQRLLADLNAQAQVLYLPAFLRHALADPLGSLRPAPALPAGGRDCFMPNRFWQTQYEETPAGWKPKFIKGKNGKPGHWSTFNHWKNCCNTVKRMVGYNAASNDRVQIVRERGKTLVGQPRAQAGLAMLDKYMALHKPVMVDVHHTYASGYNPDAPDYGTTDHFVAIVGTGTDKKGKYYRFFDVGTRNEKLGIDPRNRLYYNFATGFYEGTTQVGQKRK